MIVDLSDAAAARYEIGVLSQLAFRRTPFVIMDQSGPDLPSMELDVLHYQEVLDKVHRYAGSVGDVG